MDLQEIVRRLRMNQSIKAIKRETGKHRSVIRRVRELPSRKGGWMPRTCRRAAASRAVPRTAAGRARRRTLAAAGRTATPSSRAGTSSIR